jgi:hypothetical protein
MMKDKIILWTPDPPMGYGAFDGGQDEIEEIINADEEDESNIEIQP